MIPAKFQLSVYGRFLYLIFSLLPLLSSLFLVIPLGEHDGLPWWLVALFCLIGFSCLCLFVYAISQVLRISPRFIVSDATFTFNGLFVQKVIPWDRIVNFTSRHSFRLGFDSLSIEYVDVSTNIKKRLSVDTNGINPTHSQLIGEFMRHIPTDPIAEARVYVAYGRKPQAVQVLEKAILANPSRTDLKFYLDELRSK